MRTRFRIAAGTILGWAVTVLGPVSAGGQASDAVTAIVPDTLCGYCKDITDAVTSAGSISSAYRPGIGYAMEPQGSGAFLQPTEQQESGQKLVERLQLGTNPR
jgi:hypothetical protein